MMNVWDEMCGVFVEVIFGGKIVFLYMYVGW